MSLPDLRRELAELRAELEELSVDEEETPPPISIATIPRRTAQDTSAHGLAMVASSAMTVPR